MPKKPEVIEKLVPDTSVIVDGVLSAKLGSGEIKAGTVVIHEAVLAELEHQANDGRAIGYLGLEELKNLREISEKLGFKIEFSGTRPRPVEIKYSKLGEIDALIRDLAFEVDGTLMTSDKIQSKAAIAKGVKYLFMHSEQLRKTLKLERFFDSATMSVHLRELIQPAAKKGVPGAWKLVHVEEKPLTRDDIQEISTEIIEEAGIRRDAFIEIERPCSTIVQLGSYRIVITKPPFSDGWEITAVRPVKRLSLKEYNLSEELYRRIADHAEGILIAGPPGAGKSTFCQAIAEVYAEQNRIVKTIEAPRDLILSENVTQYAISHGDAQEIHDILLLSRPDNTIFDEMRNTEDFKLFADLRLAGIGLAGVVHATNPIDAIQRFVGRIELGVIPQIIDTVFFIKDGKPAKVLSLQIVVKVPAGMTEADLARPVVVVADFETKKPEFELYSYGEETVVVPIRSGEKSPSQNLAGDSIKREFENIVDRAEVDVVSDHKAIVYVPEKDISRVIGKEGKNINAVEKKLGISIDIQALTTEKAGRAVPFEAEITKKSIQIILDIKEKNKDVDILVDGDYLLSAKAGKTGIIKINKNNKIGKILIDAVNSGESIEVKVGN